MVPARAAFATFPAPFLAQRITVPPHGGDFLAGLTGTDPGGCHQSLRDPRGVATPPVADLPRQPAHRTDRDRMDHCLCDDPETEGRPRDTGRSATHRFGRSGGWSESGQLFHLRGNGPRVLSQMHGTRDVVRGARWRARYGTVAASSAGCPAGPAQPDPPAKVRHRSVRPDHSLHDANRLRQRKRFESTIREAICSFLMRGERRRL